MGSGTSQSFNLAGTTASADVDIANKAVHASFTVPALLGLSGDVIVVDKKAYVKTSLTGPHYMVSDVTDTAGVDPTDTGKTIDNVGDLLTQPGIEPVKGDDVACGSKQCYTVNVDLTADELSKIAGAQASSLPGDRRLAEAPDPRREGHEPPGRGHGRGRLDRARAA